MLNTLRLTSLSQIGQLVQIVTDLLKDGPVNVKVTKAARTLDQNSLFHKWCEEAADFFIARGKTEFADGTPMGKPGMKKNLKETFLGTETITSINLITGEKREYDELRKTSRLEKGEMCAFMTCIDKWASDWGIPITRPADSEYMEIMRQMGEKA